MSLTPIELALALSLALQPPGVDCGMRRAFDQPDDNGSRTVPVWESGRQGQGLFFGEALHVNTDGTRRSYSVTDFWGATIAINNLCNAMTDACSYPCDDEDEACRGRRETHLHDRRVATQHARADKWPADLLEISHISPSIIAFRGGVPCPEVDGYLVSQTALQRPVIRDVCDITNYVDALTVQAIVLPKRADGRVATPFQQRHAEIGDLAVVMNGNGTQVFYAVVGDLGPHNELGEASVALAGRLLGKTSPPANYQEIRGRGPDYEGMGWDVELAYVLILPRTGNATEPYMTQDRIDEAGYEAFRRWGGLERLTACRTAYSSR
jgi:hypothetical protein